MKNYLNGYDLEKQYNVIIPDVFKSLMAMPGRKSSLELDLEDQNGLIKDLEDPKFKARTLSFDCIQFASDELQLVQKNLALFSLLKKRGTYQFFNDRYGVQANVYYDNQAGVATPIPAQYFGQWPELRTAKIAVAFTLNFGELDPISVLPEQYLVDHKNQYLVP